MLSLTVNNTTLPGEVTEFRRGNELLWSEGTGRAANNGLMVGSVVANKQTFSIVWGVITQAQYEAIIAAFPSGFFTFRATEGSRVISNVTAYRSNITGEYLGAHGGVGYWKNVSVDLVER